MASAVGTAHSNNNNNPVTHLDKGHNKAKGKEEISFNSKSDRQKDTMVVRSFIAFPMARVTGHSCFSSAGVQMFTLTSSLADWGFWA